MDLSKLSNEELLALRDAPQDLSSMSDEELLALSGRAPSNPMESADVSVLDRATVKNLSANTEAGMKFLQEKYPSAKITNNNGDIQVNGKPLDPDNMSFSGIASYLSNPAELAQDLADIAYDIPAGMAQGAATVAGGIMGNLPGAIGASAASGAGLEALRNWAGQKAGLPQEQSTSDLVTAGAIGAATPALFGTGAGVKEFAKRGMKEVSQELLDAQKGGLSRGYNTVANKMAPKAAEFLTGTPAEAINTLKNNPDAMQALESGAELDLAKQTHSKLVEGFKNIKSTIGGKLQAAIDTTGEKVDISGVKNQFKKQISDYEAKLPKMADGSVSKESSDILAQMKSSYDDIFKGAPVEVEGLELGSDGVLKKVAREESTELPDQLSAGEAFRLQDQVKDLADMFSTKPALGAKSVSRADAAGKEIGQSAYHALNEQLDKATGGMSSELKKDYADYKKVEKYLGNYFKTPEQTFNTLTNLDKKSRIPLMRNLEDVSTKYGIDVSQDAKLLQAHAVFGDPSMQGISKGTSNTTVNSRLRNMGRLVGGAIGTGVSGPGMGTIAGGIVGGAGAEMLANPAMIKKYVGAQRAAEAGAKNLYPYLPNPKVLPSVWNMMDDRE